MSRASDDFGDLCPDTVVWTKLTGRDKYGKPVYDNPQTFVGRRVYKSARVAVAGTGLGTSGQGAEAISQSQIWILDTPDIGYEDAVYVQGDNPPYPPILSIQMTPDDVGPYYVKVFLGSALG